MQKTDLISVPHNTKKGNRIVVIARRKTQRNEKCPCKSGKKFKNCCLTPL